MTTLKQARDSGTLDQFIAEHDADEAGDETAFNATLAAMARTSKAVQEASPPPHSDD